jgi:hypothetical protein
MRLQRGVMATVDPPGWGHADDQSGERGLGYYFTEYCE